MGAELQQSVTDLAEFIIIAISGCAPEKKE